MKAYNLVTLKKEVVLDFGNKKLSFNLMPLTFARLIEISRVFNGKELQDILISPSPLDLVKIAFCLLDKNDYQKIDDFVQIEFHGSIDDTCNISEKLYYILTEVPVHVGVPNLTQLHISINAIIKESFPKPELKKKLKIQ